MKKLMLSTLVVIFIMVSCNDKNSYTLTGTIENDNANGQTAYLQKYDIDSREWQSFDSIKIENGTFSFKGIASDTPVVYSVFVEEPYIQALFIAEPGKIQLAIDTADYVVSGSPANDAYHNFRKKLDAAIEKWNVFEAKIEEAKKNGGITRELYAEYLEKQAQPDEYVQSAFDFVKANIKNPVGEYFLLDFSYNFTPEQIRTLLAEANPQYKELKRVQRLEKRLEAKEAVAAGKPYIDLKGKDLKGKDVSLFGYAGNGNVILIDFWASWCGPCRASLPEIVKLQQKFKGKKFQLIGVSLDTDQKKWEEASKKYEVTWPQLSNLKGWDDKAAQAYGVSSIPHTVLIDKNGIIVEQDIAPEFIGFKVEELLSKK